MENAPPAPSPEPVIVKTSLAGRLMNVFAAPNEVFEEIKGRPTLTANWLVPVLLSALLGVVYCQVIFSQPTVLQQLREAQERAIEKKLEKMPADQREKVHEMAEKFSNPTMMKVFGSFGAVVGSFGWLIFVAFLIWLLGKVVFKASFSYGKAIEVCGMASMINVLAVTIGMLLVIITGNMFATPGPVLLIREYDTANKVHLLLSAVNLMTFWYIGVIAVGVAKLSNVSFIKAFLWLVVPWLILRSGLILSGLGQGM